jgi:formylglycine-generating enzyme required for sulfatase activity
MRADDKDDVSRRNCCTPLSPLHSSARTAAPKSCGLHIEAKHKAISVPGGLALLGTDRPHLPEDGEGPLRKVRIKPFRAGATAVTNAEFAEFVAATGHVTDAEHFGWSFVFHAQVAEQLKKSPAVVGAEWWRRIEGATWRDVCGPGTAHETCQPDHPVVHVSWHDASTYAAWVGGRLPTEVEWEHAARGGLGDVRFPWGDQEPDDTKFMPCNIWQGHFPRANTAADGYLATSPARSFSPNGYGLYNTVGNVWEWTCEPFRIASLKREARDRQNQMKGFKLAKGGSYLCHASYCYRYRIAARTGSSPDSTTSHQSFRVVWDGQPQTPALNQTV